MHNCILSACSASLLFLYMHFWACCVCGFDLTCSLTRWLAHNNVCCHIQILRRLSFKNMQAELLEALEEEQKQQESKKASKKKKKAALKGSDKAESVDSPPDANDSRKVTAYPEPSAQPACTKCAMLQGPQKVSKRGKACSTCVYCNLSDKPSKQSPATHPSKSSSTAVRAPHSHSVHPPPSNSSGLQRLSSSSSSSDQSGSTSIQNSSGSRSPIEPGTPSSMASQLTDDGWEVQQRTKRVSAALEKQLSDSSHSLASQPRVCRTANALHPALAAAWQSTSGTSPPCHNPYMKDVLVHHVHANPNSAEVLHLASGPVSFQPPPPPPPPRTRVVAPAESKAQHAGTSPAVKAWNVTGTGAVVSHTTLVTRNAWTSAVSQVIALPPDIVLAPHTCRKGVMLLCKVCTSSSDLHTAAIIIRSQPKAAL